MFRPELFKWHIHPIKMEIGLTINFARRKKRSAKSNER